MGVAHDSEYSQFSNCFYKLAITPIFKMIFESYSVSKDYSNVNLPSGDVVPVLKGPNT